MLVCSKSCKTAPVVQVLLFGKVTLELHWAVGTAHSSVDPFTPTILWPQARSPSITSTLFLFYINCNDERTKKRSELAHSKHWNFIKCNIVCENEGNAKMLKNLISLQGHDWVDLSGRCVVDCPSLIVLKKRSKSKGLAFSSFLFY